MLNRSDSQAEELLLRTISLILCCVLIPAGYSLLSVNRTQYPFQFCGRTVPESAGYFLINVRKRPSESIVIQAVTDDEGVGNFEPHVGNIVECVLDSIGLQQ